MKKKTWLLLIFAGIILAGGLNVNSAEAGFWSNVGNFISDSLLPGSGIVNQAVINNSDYLKDSFGSVTNYAIDSAGNIVDKSNKIVGNLHDYTIDANKNILDGTGKVVGEAGNCIVDNSGNLLLEGIIIGKINDQDSSSDTGCCGTNEGELGIGKAFENGKFCGQGYLYDAELSGTNLPVLGSNIGDKVTWFCGGSGLGQNCSCTATRATFAPVPAPNSNLTPAPAPDWFCHHPVFHGRLGRKHRPGISVSAQQGLETGVGIFLSLLPLRPVDLSCGSRKTLPALSGQ